MPRSNSGLDTWFFLTADYAFGQDLEKDTTNVVLKSGGKVLGSVRHPLNTSDFSSYLLQAQASKAKVIGLANAGGDTINAIKQAAEFGLMKGGQKLSPLLAFVTDIDSVGLETAQGLLLAEAFYWDLNDDTRAFSKRFMERMKRVPTSAQAGVYSSVMHYLQAVKAAGTTDSAAVMKIMKDTPINDMFAKNGRIREDGRMVHDMYLFEVKKPSESKGRWDDYKLLATVPGDRGVPVARTVALPAGEEVTVDEPPFVIARSVATKQSIFPSATSGLLRFAPAMTVETTTNNNERQQSMSANDMVLQNLDSGLLTITMNRPDRRNALNPDMTLGLVEAARRAAEDHEVRAVLLKGAGGTFCVGGDVKSMAEGRAPLPFEAKMANLRRGMEVSRILHEMPKPVVAQVDGAAAGAGLSIALACDLRVASASVKITTAFAKVGLSGDYGGTYFLTHLLGSAKARELYLMSPVLTAQEALALGIVTRVVPDAEVEAAAHELAMSLAQGPSVTLGYIKRNINNAEHLSLEACFDAEAIHHSRAGETADHKEAAKAFVEKRKPVFQGH